MLVLLGIGSVVKMVDEPDYVIEIRTCEGEDSLIAVGEITPGQLVSASKLDDRSVKD